MSFDFCCRPLKPDHSTTTCHDVATGSAERNAEPSLHHLGHAGAHEIDDLLRRVDDAMRVGDLNRVALEEALVDGVEEVLLLREVLEPFGRRLNGSVEGVERLQELDAAEALERE